MSKKIFLVGDFRSNTGPAIANVALKNALGKNVFCSFARTRFCRILELLIRMPFCNTVCFCSFSVLDVYGIKLAKFLKKNTAYLMHGYIEFEDKINHIIPSTRELATERYIIENVNTLICVSELLANKIRQDYSNRDNIYVIYNIVNITRKHEIEKDPLMILSTGGGMPRKNNLAICEAIKNINNGLTRNKKIRYIVAGKSYDYEEEFKKYDFVDFIGDVSHDEVLRLMSKSKIYIQNSIFETFGLAVVESIECGCDVILSKNIGALEVIKGLKDGDIINDSNRIVELEEKIMAKISDEKKFSGAVDWERISTVKVKDSFLKILGGGCGE